MPKPPQKRLHGFVFLTAMCESACFPRALRRQSTVLLAENFKAFQMTDITTLKEGRGGSSPKELSEQAILTMYTWAQELNKL